jgi:RNA polymerase sigma-70 factor (ECF subfamily)
LQQQDKLATFETAVLPHLDAAYNLARWLTRNDADAEDVVQEAYLRAFRFFGGFHGEDGRAWLLGIINLYIWPAEQSNTTGEVAAKRQGYNLLHWTNSGMNYWAVSDLNGVELHEFARLVQEAQ